MTENKKDSLLQSKLVNEETQPAVGRVKPNAQIVETDVDVTESDEVRSGKKVHGGMPPASGQAKEGIGPLRTKDLSG